MIGRRRVLQLAAGAPTMFCAAPSNAQTVWTARGPRVPGVVLQDQENRSWPLEPLLFSRPAVVVSFFFTGCGTICPPQTAMLRDLRDELVRRVGPGVPDATPLLLSISLDPLGDTPEEIRAYARRFGAPLGMEEGWLMLTGEPRHLARSWAAFEAPAGQPEDHAAVLWVGRRADRRWTRASALSPPERLANLLLGQVG